MNIPFVVETVLHDGLLKYKFKNSKIRSITTKPGKSKGAIFAYRSKKSMIGGRGVVLTSEEAIHEKSRYIYALDTKRLSLWYVCRRKPFIH